MSSSTSKTADTEASKSNASSLVLSVLAACSSAVLVMGKEGEATLFEQLSDLLQDKAMAVEELNLLYSYKFGFNLIDALKLVGFEGNLQDYFGQQKRLSMHGDLISVTPLVAMSKGESLENIKLASLEELSSGDPLPSQGDYDKSEDNETNSVADTESTTDAESWCCDIDPDLDVIGWHTVGNRLVAALNSPNLHNDDDDDDVAPSKGLGGRVVADTNEEVTEEVAPNRASWQDVGCRLALACQKSSDGESGQESEEYFSAMR